jgi:Uncharacterized conserved protein
VSFETVNSKVVRAHVGPGTPVLARRGAMLGYSGQVTFRPVPGQGRGIGGVVGAAMSGESNPMMATEGTGQVLYGYRGLHVTVLELDGGAPLVCEADRLLAHDATLQTSVQFLGSGGIRSAISGAMTGQGLFTTNVHGRGAVALLSHGGAFPLRCTAPRSASTRRPTSATWGSCRWTSRPRSASATSSAAAPVRRSS